MQRLSPPTWLVIFAFLALMLFMLTRTAAPAIRLAEQRRALAASWTEVQATVIESQVVQSGAGHNLRVKFRFGMGVQEFVGTRFGLEDSYGQAFVFDAKQKLFPGKRTSAWVDPRNPSTAVLYMDPPPPHVPPIFLSVGYGASVGLLVVGVGLFLRARAQAASAEPEATPEPATGAPPTDVGDEEDDTGGIVLPATAPGIPGDNREETGEIVVQPMRR